MTAHHPSPTPEQTLPDFRETLHKALQEMIITNRLSPLGSRKM